jgi:hypothetical protein
MCFMRTTVELPSDLLRAAKARSAESGESLKNLLTRAVAAELDTPIVRRGEKSRVRLPLFGAPSGARVQVPNSDLERALADVAGLPSSGTSRRRRHRSR